MSSVKQKHEYDSYEFTMIDTTGKRYSVAMNHMGTSEELEEFFTLVARVAGFNWVRQVYMIPEPEENPLVVPQEDQEEPPLSVAKEAIRRLKIQNLREMD
jgi:hypothetical protein